MKSKKAKKYLDERANASYDNRLKVTQYDARKAVELAEQDARDRTIKVFCTSCGKTYCREFNDYLCKEKQLFITHYDNEEN